MNKIKKFFSKHIYLKNDTVYASPFKRFASFVVDLLIIVVFFNVVIGIANHYGFDSKIYKEEIVVENKGTDNEIINVKENIDTKVFSRIYFIVFGISAIYFTLFLSSKKQATIGNQLFKIMIVHTKKSKISPIAAFIRFIAMILNNYLYGVGYLLYFFRKDHAFLHDVLSDTRVVNLSKN